MSWYFIVLQKYITLKGRARRKEFWYFLLFHNIIAAITMILDSLVWDFDLAKDGMGFLTIAYVLATIPPSIAVCVRRLHDTGRSGWWIFIPFVPVIGAFLWLYFTLQNSEPGDSNRFGPNPKANEM